MLYKSAPRRGERVEGSRQGVKSTVKKLANGGEDPANGGACMTVQKSLCELVSFRFSSPKFIVASYYIAVK